MLSAETVDSTLGVLLKYRDGLEVVRAAGLVGPGGSGPRPGRGWTIPAKVERSVDPVQSSPNVNVKVMSADA